MEQWLQPRFYIRFCAYQKYNHIIGTQKTDTLVVKDASENSIFAEQIGRLKIDVYVDNQKFLPTSMPKNLWPLTFDQKNVT